MTRDLTRHDAATTWSDAEPIQRAAQIQRTSSVREAAINEIALLMLTSVELGSLLATLARHASLVMSFDIFDVLLRDENQADLTLYKLHDGEDGGSGVRSAPAAEADRRLHARALDHAVATMFEANDPQDEANELADAPWTDQRICAALSVPLTVDDKVVGALGFFSREPGAYDEDDLRLAQLLAQPIASAFRNAMLYARERRRSHKLRALQRVGAAATTTLDRDALLEEACTQISAEFGYYKVNLATIDDENVHIAPRHRLFRGRSHGPDGPGDVIPRTFCSLMTTAANERRVVHAPNVTEHPRYYPEPNSQTRSEAAFPIVWRDRIFGVLDVQSERVDAFTEEDLQLLCLLANHLAAGLENCRLYDQVNVLLDTYVPTSVARRLRAEPERPVAGGTCRQISILFADLRGFTRHAEGKDPVRLLQTLNLYLGIATAAVTELGGTVDKFMGDGVMVLFNAPEDQPDHALRAVEAAMLIQQRMAPLFRGSGEELCFGIGINTGDVVVGNIGTSTVLNYTAIGDPVNVAKRLQERARGGQVLISGPTQELVREQVATDWLGPLALHNRRGAIDAYLVKPRGDQRRSSP